MKKGYTLIEILIVMAIMIFLMGLSATAFIDFRSRTQLENAYVDLESLIRLARNNALNSVSFDYGTSLPDYYFITFANNNYSLETCLETSPGSLACNVLQQDLRPTNFGGILIQGTCNAIGFKRRTGVVYSSKEVLNPAQNVDCNLKLVHQNLLTGDREILVNITNNDIIFEDKSQ